jgi:hypothetical protein
MCKTPSEHPGKKISLPCLHQQKNPCNCQARDLRGHLTQVYHVLKEPQVASTSGTTACAVTSIMGVTGFGEELDIWGIFWDLGPLWATPVCCRGLSLEETRNHHAIILAGAGTLVVAHQGAIGSEASPFDRV